jgi:FMN phosphatase YigB (HAD superfamily)
MLQGIKAVLFDLDGTLLDLDMDRFLPVYVKALSDKCAKLVSPGKFAYQLLESCNRMIESKDPRLTNEAVFALDFFPKVESSQEELTALIDDFYANDFNSLCSLSRIIPYSRDSVESVRALGLTTVLATNPVFPLSAIRHRIRWAGLDESQFDLITSYENMHFCKPNPEYYLEIADKIGYRTGECLMVGNDVDEDLAAKIIGMKTFLVNERQVNRRKIIPDADYNGSLSELLTEIGRISC